MAKNRRSRMMMLVEELRALLVEEDNSAPRMNPARREANKKTLAAARIKRLEQQLSDARKVIDGE